MQFEILEPSFYWIIIIIIIYYVWNARGNFEKILNGNGIFHKIALGNGIRPSDPPDPLSRALLLLLFKSLRLTRNS